MSPEDLADVMRLNVVMDEDDRSVTVRPACPTAAHRPEKVASYYVVRFACDHGQSQSAFCVPCTADRRTGIFACIGEHLVDGLCPGSIAVEVKTYHARTIIKDC